MTRSLIAMMLATGIVTTASAQSTDIMPQSGKTASGFSIHETAPETVTDIYEFYTANFGFVPNLAKVMAGSPALMRSYTDTQKNLKQYAHLSQAEINVVQLSLAVENKCKYCTAGHTMAGQSFFKTPMQHMQEIREREILSDPKLNVLRNFALHVYHGRGSVSDTEIKKFYSAGYSREQAMDVVACIAAKVMSNYTNALAKTELDKPMQPFAQGLSFNHQ